MRTDVLVRVRYIISNFSFGSAKSTANTDRMLETGKRAANAEHASLLDEVFDIDDETEDVIIDWS